MPLLAKTPANLFYQLEGAGDETVVFAHGLLFDHRMWQHQVSHFRATYRCIAYDHRGQGQSAVVLPMDMDTLYEDAVRLIEALSPDKPVHFVGLSMGGFVGMRLAARRPDLLRSLSLIATSAEPEPNRLKYHVLSFIFKTAGPRLVSGKIIRILFGKSSLRDPAREPVVALWKKTIEGYPKTITQAVAGVISRKSVERELVKIHIPTQIMVGEEDVATDPGTAERIHRLIPESSLHLIPAAGHSACLEQPEQVNHLLDEFFRSSSVRQGTRAQRSRGVRQNL